MKTDSTPEADLRLAVIKAAFQRLAPDLERFADRRSLHIERQQRGFSVWTFMFRHPRGGVASLQLSIDLTLATGDLRAAVLARWWVDVAYERRRRAAEFATIHVESLEPGDVLETLERGFARVLVADETALTRAGWWPRREDSPDLPPPPA